MLGTPPAFVLSQDQTLIKKVCLFVYILLKVLHTIKLKGSVFCQLLYYNKYLSSCQHYFDLFLKSFYFDFCWTQLIEADK
ncbi:hypothetical protein C3E90_01560 [Clostridium sp. Cult2]|nr:hypothetical protein [Clostridium sp. Cult2]